MDNVTIERKITLSLNAEDWDLYTHAFTETELTQVTNRINAEISLVLNKYQQNEQEAWMLCERVLATYSHYGASDTEPRNVLHGIFSNFYPED